MDSAAGEFDAVAPGARRLTEGGLQYVYLPNLSMPPGCIPATVDCLLCLDSVNGYTSRLYFAQQVSKAGVALNWNGNTHILGRNWVAYSWNNVATNQHPVGILLGHLAPFRP
jgi:hypothetical protein